MSGLITTRREQPQPRVFDGKVELALRERLGEGGEGSVHSIKSDRNLVAKVYKDKSDTPKKLRKVKRLVAMHNEKLCQAAAWPERLITDEKGECAGFLMEFLQGWVPLYSIYQVKSRVRIMPGRNWAYLVRVARNLATCVHYVHEEGIVIGDLNESNVLVSGQAMVKLVDVDSFQVNCDGEVLTVDVGKTELIAPEIQGRSLDGRVRTQEEDRFALAVLLFHILVFGRHPYAGRPKDKSIEHSLEACIENHFYAFTRRRDVPITPPPYLDLSFLPERIQHMFEDAFEGNPTKRPSAFEWFMALKELENSLKDCGKAEAHRHWEGLQHCPWCDLEDKWNVYLFAPNMSIGATLADFDIDYVWDNILTITPPPEQPFGSEIAKVDKVGIPRKHKVAGWLSRVGQFPIALIIPLANLARASIPWLVVSIGLIVACWAFVLFSGVYQRFNRLRKDIDSLDEQIEEHKERWKTVADPTLFEKKLEEIKLAKEQFKDRRARYDALRINALRTTYSRQLDSFLRKYSVLVADVKVNTEELSALERQGIRTAADITRKRLAPFAFQKTAEELLKWRDALEAQYWASTSHPLSGAVERQIQTDLDREDLKLKAEILDGKKELEELSRSLPLYQDRIRIQSRPLLEQRSRVAAELDGYCKILGREDRALLGT